VIVAGVEAAEIAIIPAQLLERSAHAAGITFSPNKRIERIRSASGRSAKLNSPSSIPTICSSTTWSLSAARDALGGYEPF
jgi:hypothetical protein